MARINPLPPRGEEVLNAFYDIVLDVSVSPAAKYGLIKIARGCTVQFQKETERGYEQTELDRRREHVAHDPSVG